MWFVSSNLPVSCQCFHAVYCVFFLMRFQSSGSGFSNELRMRKSIKINFRELRYPQLNARCFVRPVFPWTRLYQLAVNFQCYFLPKKKQKFPGFRFRSLRICADLQDFRRSLQICAELQNFSRSLQIQSVFFSCHTFELQ